MQVIQLIHPYSKQQVPVGPIVLALGFFDGVHRGHQAVIQTARKVATEKQLPLAVMTFDIHPAIVYRQANPATFRYLSTTKRQIELMQAQGVDILFVVHFTPAFARLAPQMFVDDYLVGLNATTVVAGFDYTYGPKTIANMSTLPTYARERFEIICVKEHDFEGHKISSTYIRTLIDQGRVELANRLLGYIYQTTGIVVHGEARGRQLGFPTANIEAQLPERLPGIGIYAVKLWVNGKWYLGMASIGRNVTFHHNNPVTVEINLLDFNADIYGEAVQVEWHQYLRGEVKFDSADALIEQLHADERQVRAYFKTKVGQ